jgi:hypothetical protein
MHSLAIQQYFDNIYEPYNVKDGMSGFDYTYLSKLSYNAGNKLEKRLNSIKYKITNGKNVVGKHYQVNGYREAKILGQWCTENNIGYEIVVSTSQFHNKLIKIKGGNNSQCCFDCDGRPSFVNTKIPVLYVKILSLNNLVKSASKI